MTLEKFRLDGRVATATGAARTHADIMIMRSAAAIEDAAGNGLDARSSRPPLQPLAGGAGR